MVRKDVVPDPLGPGSDSAFRPRCRIDIALVHRSSRGASEEGACTGARLNYCGGSGGIWYLHDLARPESSPGRSRGESEEHPGATGERTRTTRTSSAIPRGQPEEHAGP